MRWLQHAGLRTRILLPLTLLLGALLTALLLVYRGEELAHFQEDAQRRFRITENSFQSALSDQADMLSAQLDNVLANRDFATALRQRDRQGLYQMTQGLFQHLRARHNITHFYFFTPDRVVLLRVHQPGRHSDKINRQTALQAEATRKPAHGAELGPLGTFTLRNVYPWFQDGELIGYVEMGVEVEPLLDKVKDITGTHIYVSIKKQLLDKKGWQEGMRMLGRAGEWERLPGEVITFDAHNQITEKILRDIALESRHFPDIQLISAGEKSYSTTVFDLNDAAGKTVGKLLLAHDITRRMQSNQALQTLVSLSIAGVSSAILVFFYILLGRIERDQAFSSQALVDSAREREEQQSLHIRELEQEQAALRLAQEKLQSSEKRLEEAQRMAHLGNWEWDIKSGSLFWSDEIFRIFGQSPQSFTPSYEAFLGTVHPDDMHAVKHAINRALYENHPYRVDHRIRLPSNSIRHVHEHGEVVFDENGEALRMIGTVQDVTERKKTIDQLNYLAYYDGLTGLPNRTLFIDRLSQTIIEAARHKHITAIVLLDIDQLKQVNENMGHDAGDELLKAVAARLKSITRKGDTLARISSDEFSIILADMAHTDDIPNILQNILETFNRPIVIASKELFITCCIGITLHPTDGTDIDELLRNADSALFHAKELGRNNYQFYAAEMTSRANERFELESSLRRALEKNELQLYYQPQIALDSGRVKGAEALLRWQHGKLGTISPAKFIPLAEETGLIIPIGEWVLNNAVTQLKSWNEAGFTDLKVAVNLSSRQFMQNDILRTVAHALDQSGITPSSLELEITESLLMEDRAQVAIKLNSLKALGVSISMDDFGTGYSSLSYLKRFHIDVLKIDQSFTRDVLNGPDDAALVRAIIAMAHSLNLKVIAEGVETEAQLSFMRREGCHEVQGFYFARPMPADELLNFLRSKA